MGRRCAHACAFACLVAFALARKTLHYQKLMYSHQDV